MQKVIAWIKTHKAAAAALAGGGFLLLKNKGSGSASVTDSSGDTSTDGSTVQLVPVTTGPIEDTGSGDLSDGSGQDVTIPPDTTPPDNAGETPDPTDAGTGAAPVAAPAPPDQKSGAGSVVIAGKTFAGATGHSIVGSGSNSNGHFTTHLITYPGKTERWNHYSSGAKAGQWVGPFGGNVTSQTQPTSAPTGAPKPTTTSPAPKAPVAAKPPSASPSITVAGKTFPGGTNDQNVTSGSNSNGHYTTHQITFADGHHEKWNHYSSGAKSGQWVGPF